MPTQRIFRPSTTCYHAFRGIGHVVEHLLRAAYLLVLEHVSITRHTINSSLTCSELRGRQFKLPMSTVTRRTCSASNVGLTCTINTPSAHSCSFLGIEDFGSDARLRAGVSLARGGANSFGRHREAYSMPLPSLRPFFHIPLNCNPSRNWYLRQHSTITRKCAAIDADEARANSCRVRTCRNRGAGRASS